MLILYQTSAAGSADTTLPRGAAALPANGRPRTRTDLERSERRLVRELTAAGLLVQVGVDTPDGTRVAWTLPPAPTA